MNTINNFMPVNYQATKLNEIENINRPMISKENEPIIKNLSTKKVQD